MKTIKLARPDPQSGEIAIFRGSEISGLKQVKLNGRTRNIDTKLIKFSDISDAELSGLGSREAVLRTLNAKFRGFDENEIVTVVLFL